MISDILSDCAHQIREYLEYMPDAYAPVRGKIDSLLIDVDHLRIILDTPPENDNDS